jgi:3-oxoacyl-(acyl-carrier-protein) synthase
MNEPMPAFAELLRPKTDAERAAAQRYAELARAREDLTHREKPAPQPLTPARSEAIHRALGEFVYWPMRHESVIHSEETGDPQ